MFNKIGITIVVIVAGVTLGKAIKEPLRKLTGMTSSAHQASTQIKATPALPSIALPRIALPRNGVLEDYSKRADTGRTFGKLRIYSAPPQEPDQSRWSSKCPEARNNALLKKHHYFVRVSDWKSNQMVLTAFIQAGKRIELKLPTGSYRIRYATGFEWYGEKHLFGENTRYMQLMDKDIAKQPLKIELSQQQFWNIALFPCGTEGTMREEAIDPDNF